MWKRVKSFYHFNYSCFDTGRNVKFPVPAFSMSFKFKSLTYPEPAVWWSRRRSSSRQHTDSVRNCRSYTSAPKTASSWPNSRSPLTHRVFIQSVIWKLNQRFPQLSVIRDEAVWQTVLTHFRQWSFAEQNTLWRFFSAIPPPAHWLPSLTQCSRCYNQITRPPPLLSSNINYSSFFCFFFIL